MTDTLVAGIFVKLIVADEVAMAEFYQKTYGMKEVTKVQGDSAGNGEAFREVILSADGQMTGQSLVLFNFVNRPKPRDQQSILGMIVTDMEQLKERIVANGGKLVGPTRDMVEYGVRVQFAEDPEGALIENVQMLG